MPMSFLRCLILLVCGSSLLLGQQGTFVNQAVGTPLQGGETFRVEVNDLVTTSSGPTTSRSFRDSDVRFIVSIDQVDLAPVPEGSYNLLVEVEYVKQGNQTNPAAPELERFNIVVDANPGGGLAALIPEEIQNSWRLDVKVLSVSYEGGPVPEGNALEMALIAEISEYAEPCTFDPTTRLGHPVFRKVESTLIDEKTEKREVDTSTDRAGNVIVQVAEMACASEYDLEYVFYDADSDIGKMLSGTTGGTAMLDDLFRHNATRLTSALSKFRIFNLYREGQVVARYRAVAYDKDLRVYTHWSSYEKSIQDVIADDAAGRISVEHQSGLNWQATTNFAEDAKQLPAVSYLDGTMRGRQNLVLQYGEVNDQPDPTTEFVIGQQTIYDAMGRPAVSVLPAPIYPTDTDLHPLRFDARELVKPLGQTGDESFQIYGVDQVEAEGECAAEAMGADAGAGKFYSPEDTLPQNAFVPDSEGYPFAVTRYTPDNTGRVRRQGGVGPRLRVGEHDTRYFYGKPHQWELDRLFGVNVGLAAHYQKTMVVDPNGQATVSYLDAKGRTVATALAGASPKNLIPINQVIADFTFAVDKTMEGGLTLDFDNKSSGAETYEWDFAGLGNSTEQNPSYTFPEAGTYVICLTATGTTGAEKTCQYIPIEIELDLAQDVLELQRGFNLVSLDVAPPDNRITKVFAELIGQGQLLYVQGRNELGGLELFNPKLSPEENVLTTLRAGRGYMVGVTEDVAVTIEGLVIDEQFKPTLYQGVNIIPYLPQESTDAVGYFRALIPSEGNLVFARTYTNGRFVTYRPGYHTESPFEMVNGKAYEIFIGSQVDGDEWLEENGGEDGFASGPTYGEDLVSNNGLDRSPLLIGDENDMSVRPVTIPDPPSAATVTVEITNNVRYANEVQSTYTLLVPDRGSYDICYALQSATYANECCPRVPVDNPEGPQPPEEEEEDDLPDNSFEVGRSANIDGGFRYDCFECYYDVTITITAISLCEDGTTQLDGVPITLTNQSAAGNYNECFADDGINLAGLMLEVGEYRISKTVTLHEPAVAAALEEYLDLAACVETEETFVEQYVAAVDTSGCAPCDCSLEYEELSDNCKSFCDKPDPCTSLEAQMRGDMRPGGQYARYRVAYDNDGVAEYFFGYRSSVDKTTEEREEAENAYIFSLLAPLPDDPGRHYFQTIDWGTLQGKDATGELKKIDQLSVKAFVENFDEQWLDLLITFHPEYDLYTWCRDNIASRADNGAALPSSTTFDEQLRTTNTYSNANSAYTTTDRFSAGDITEFLSDLARNNDLFFDEPAHDVETFISQHIRGNNSLSIQSLVITQLNEFFPGTGTGWSWATAPDYQRDMAWQIARDLYLGRKATYVDQLQTSQNGNANSLLWPELYWKCLSQPACLEFNCTPVTKDCPDIVLKYYVANVTQLSRLSVVAADYPESEEDILDPDGTFGRQIASVKEKVGADCATTCEAYVPVWRTELNQCPTLAAAPATVDKIIGELKAICAAGCVGGLPNGSSSVPENVVFGGPAQRNTFQKVVGYYLDQLAGNTTDCDRPATCQSTLITFPQPADRDYYGGTLSLAPGQAGYWLATNRAFLQGRLDFLQKECACSSCTVSATAASAGLPTESIEVIARLNQMSVASVQRTLDLIGQFVQEDEVPRSTEILFNLEIPAEFNPGGQFCITRTLFENKYQADFNACTQLPEESRNEQLAEYLNGRLGWSRTYEEYASLLADTASTCMICADPPVAPIERQPTCGESIRFQAQQDAYDQYTRYVDRKSAGFEREYRNTCLDRVMTSDRIDLRYTPREYQYTLYYYDQAGNLAMTVPPTGVKPLSTSQVTSASGVDNYRKSIVQGGEEEMPFVATDMLPRHSLLTHYRYNSFNEVIASDAPDKDPAYTWYDPIGRAVLSRDGRQQSLGKYSYTLYDALGRPTEVGEFDGPSSGINLPAIARDGDLANHMNSVSDRNFVTRTYYTETPFPIGLIDADAYKLRNRVAASTFRAEWAGSEPDAFDYASHYSYDIAGNVATLVQDFAELPADQRYKTLDYDYDLISGNVHYLHYQRGRADQFTYYYRYDKLNRLDGVYTSEIETRHSRSNLWKRDAAYTYYDHGPLRRTVLGQRGLQGLDYAYTLQGWIKGVNGSLGDDYREVASPDMGMDGFPEAPDAPADRLAYRDLYRYANQYFHEDYKPIGGTLNPMDNVLPPDYELFNGNIVRHYQSTAADGFRTAALVGEYDQLNRLRFGNNAFYGQEPTDLSLTDALEAPTYDGNGNIRTLDRSYTSTAGEGTNRIGYDYRPGTNLLTSVRANVRSTVGSEAWQPFDLMQGVHRYGYDASGNLISESSDETSGATTTIDWNPYGKVTTVSRPGGATDFGYGPDQNRWKKAITKDDGEARSTYYVRDAQGSTIATYSSGGDAGADLVWKEQYLYGSSRLGQVTMNRELSASAVTATPFGERRYELTNHLGNVSTVFGEYARQYADAVDNTLYSAPQIISQQDYFAFGLGLERGPGVMESGYRYGFNGKELDDGGEWGGSTTAYDYGFRIYNPQLARFLSVDPLTKSYPTLTPYQYASNSPIANVDLDGLESHYADIWFANRRGQLAAEGLTSEEITLKIKQEKRESVLFGTAIIFGAGGLAVFGPELALTAFSYPISTIEFASGVAAFGIGYFDEAGQLQMPGPFDDGGRSTAIITAKFKQLFTSSKGKKIVEFFGGKFGQVKEALNVDVVASQGIKGSIKDFANLAMREGLSGKIDKIVASGPQATFIEESARLLKSGGQLIINSTKGNKFGKLPSAEKLEELGLKIIQQSGELLEEFKGQTFRRSDGSVIPSESVKTTILEKI